jgi:hypothetical protein
MLLDLIINGAGRGRTVCDKQRQAGQTKTDDEIVIMDMIRLVLRMQREPVQNIWDKHRKLYMMHKKWLKAIGNEARCENSLCILPLRKRQTCLSRK